MINYDKFCNKCKHYKFTLSEGILCGLTDTKPAFVDECENFECDPTRAKKLEIKEKRKANKKKRFKNNNGENMTYKDKLIGKIECPKCEVESYGNECTSCGYKFTNKEFANKFSTVFIKGIKILIGSIILLLILYVADVDYSSKNPLSFLGVVAIIGIFIYSPLFIIFGLIGYFKYKFKNNKNMSEEKYKNNKEIYTNKSMDEFLCKTCKHYDKNSKACTLYRFYVESDYKKYEKLCNGKYYAAITV